MSVEKLNSSFIKQEKPGFTTHLNKVLQNISYPEALGVWCYLTSLPDNWEVNTTQLMNHFDIGRDKINKILKYLIDQKLIERYQDKNEAGHFGKSYILVKVGYEFIENIGKNSGSSTPSSLSHEPVDRVLKTPDTDYPDTANPQLQKKYNIKTNNKRKKQTDEKPNESVDNFLELHTDFKMFDCPLYSTEITKYVYKRGTS